MLTYIPYRDLKKDERAYQIMLFRDQRNMSFTQIAKAYQISAQRASQTYYRQKVKQKRLYMHHIAFSLGHENILQIRKDFSEAYECYREQAYVCAYIEKKYSHILTPYRKGEPGMPLAFMKNIPPFQLRLEEAAVERVVDMRENKKVSFAVIAKELCITPQKARDTYEQFYHQKSLALIRHLQEKTEGAQGQPSIWVYYFQGYKSAKNRYDMLTKNPSAFLKGGEENPKEI